MLGNHVVWSWAVFDTANLRSGASVALALLAGAGVLTSCGSDENTEEAFCAEAEEFQEYQQVLGLVLFDQDDTRDFFAGSIERIKSLADAAPPTVAVDVAILRDGFIELDQAMAAADYDILVVPDEALNTTETDAASKRVDEFLDAACRDEGDPITGFNEDPLAPRILSVSEIEQLQGTVNEENGDLERLVALQLADEFGLTAAESSCIVAELDVSLITSLAGGDPITTVATERFARALGTCEIDVAQLGG